MTLKEQFETAVAESKTLPQKPGNDTLLKIYSLFKQATEGDAPQEATYGMFDFVGKAKHEAWKQTNGLSAEGAMQQYVELIESLKNK
jgi:diazepam-binding inhibitor (GABA receptor modulating acyl-CoA-binding protein)